MKFRSDHFQSSAEEVKGIFEEAMRLFDESAELLGEFYNESFDLNKSTRFWKIVLYKFLVKYAQDVITADHTQYTSVIQDTGELIVPFNNHVYSDLRHNDERFYQQFFTEADLEKPLSIKGYKPTGKKRGLMNNLFKIQGKLYAGVDSIPLIKDFYPDYWKLHYPQSKVYQVRLRDENIKPNPETAAIKRKALYQWLVGKGMKEYYARGLAFSLPYNMCEDMNENLQRVLKLMSPSNPRIVLSGWCPDLWTSLLCAEWVERGAELQLIQHGGGYGEDPQNMGNLIEQGIADVFFSWSQPGYNSHIRPVAPTRLIHFRIGYEKYVASQNSGKNKEKYDILILDGMHYRTPTFNDLKGNLGARQNVFDFLEQYKNGDGEGVVLRLYQGKYARNEQFEKELKKRFPHLAVNDQSVPMYKNLYESKKVLMNLKYSTARWEAASVGKEVSVLFSENSDS